MYRLPKKLYILRVCIVLMVLVVFSIVRDSYLLIVPRHTAKKPAVNVHHVQPNPASQPQQQSKDIAVRKKNVLFDHQKIADNDLQGDVQNGRGQVRYGWQERVHTKRDVEERNNTDYLGLLSGDNTTWSGEDKAYRVHSQSTPSPVPQRSPILMSHEPQALVKYITHGYNKKLHDALQHSPNESTHGLHTLDGSNEWQGQRLQQSPQTTASEKKKNLLVQNESGTMTQRKSDENRLGHAINLVNNVSHHSDEQQLYRTSEQRHQENQSFLTFPQISNGEKISLTNSLLHGKQIPGTSLNERQSQQNQEQVPETPTKVNNDENSRLTDYQSQNADQPNLTHRESLYTDQFNLTTQRSLHVEHSNWTAQGSLNNLQLNLTPESPNEQHLTPEESLNGQQSLLTPSGLLKSNPTRNNSLNKLQLKRQSEELVNKEQADVAYGYSLNDGQSNLSPNESVSKEQNHLTHSLNKSQSNVKSEELPGQEEMLTIADQPLRQQNNTAEKSINKSQISYVQPKPKKQWHKIPPDYSKKVKFIDINNKPGQTPIKILAWSRDQVIRQVILATGTDSVTLDSGLKCLLTRNRSEYNQSEAIIFKLSSERGIFSMPRHRFSNQKWVVYDNEPPPRCDIRWPGKPDINYIRHMFNITSFFVPDSTVPYRWPYYKQQYKVINGRKYLHYQSLNLDFAAQKTRNVAWFVSHCNTQSQREVYVQELQKYIDVDIYGDCGNLSCGTSHRRGDCDFTVLNKTYRFYLSFENSLCEGYITEKLWRILGHPISTIPITMGLEYYLNFLPHRTVIDIKQYNNPRQLAKRLHEIAANPQTFNDFILRKLSLKHLPNTEYTTPYIYRLCEHLHNHRHQREVVEDVKEFWSVDRRCLQPWKQIPGSFWTKPS